MDTRYLLLILLFFFGIGLALTGYPIAGLIISVGSVFIFSLVYISRKETKEQKELKEKRKQEMMDEKKKDPIPEKKVELTEQEKKDIETEEQLNKIIAQLVSNEDTYISSVVRHSVNNQVVSIIEGFTDTYRTEYEINLENKVIDEEETVYATTSRSAESRVEKVFERWAKEERLLTHPEEIKPKRKKKTTPKAEDPKPINEKIITSIKTVVDGGVTYTVIVCELKGLFYRDQEAKDEAAKLVVGSPLNIKVDEDNKGLKVVTLNDIHLGYVPADLSPVFYQQIETLASCIVHSKDDMRIPHIWIETIFKK